MDTESTLHDDKQILASPWQCYVVWTLLQDGLAPDLVLCLHWLTNESAASKNASKAEWGG